MLFHITIGRGIEKTGRAIKSYAFNLDKDIKGRDTRQNQRMMLETQQNDVGRCSLVTFKLTHSHYRFMEKCQG